MILKFVIACHVSTIPKSPPKIIRENTYTDQQGQFFLRILASATLERSESQPRSCEQLDGVLFFVRKTKTECKSCEPPIIQDKRNSRRSPKLEVTRSKVNISLRKQTVVNDCVVWSKNLIGLWCEVKLAQLGVKAKFGLDVKRL